MEVWERARVLALAADDASRRAAVALLSASAWPEAGCTLGEHPLLWGRCRGSATYPVVVRPGATYRCSCPSRKLPCKHALALMLRWAGGELSPAEPPAYAQLPDAAPDAPAVERVPDAEAAAQRAAARAERVAAGLDELDRWLGDQVRAGLAGLERAGWSHFEAIAARMVDAQAPGVAGLLRGLPALMAQDGWPEQVLDALAGLHLLVRAHRGLDALPADLAATVRSRVGYPVAKALVLAGPAVVDHWLALGAVDVLEGRLESRRVWLWGTSTRRWALLLSFAVPGAGLDESVAVGQVLFAALHFYPGAGEHRALVGEQWPPDAVVTIQPEAPAAARERWAAQVAADPWATRMPVVLDAVPVPPAGPRQPWRLRGDDGWAVPVVGLPADPWPLLALAADGRVPVFGEWGRGGFRPLRVVGSTGDAGPPRLLAVA
jgi:hypothetical protein